ncbi:MULTISPECIES: signal peptidase I [Inquilinus]|jgi:signal peptidase I|uniref:Signal peptidase I n=1 Tax=Inquilinus ginsengisoli TaxID=363840 RepID=A0ABU1JTA3_9PROT|nr:signal peptidase I [Inquilinus ginsengisoli]MDR6291209.1 signal peptidase I [Inquilinus ginsengisoli]
MTQNQKTIEMSKKKSGGWLETILTVVYAIAIAFGIRTVAFEPFNIPSGSMIPTLLVGDYLFVSKFSYGYSAQTIAFGLPLFDGRILGSPPQRGDVAVFRLPRDTSVDFVKRVIGLPGDHIQVTGGRLYINGQLTDRREIEPYASTNQYGQREVLHQYIETLPGTNGGAPVEHKILEKYDNGPSDNTPEYVVPADHYFMMGDNRDNSDDSRGIVGYVPVENFVGRAEILWFSLDDASFWQVWKWPFALRFSRMFTGIH